MKDSDYVLNKGGDSADLKLVPQKKATNGEPTGEVNVFKQRRTGGIEFQGVIDLAQISEQEWEELAKIRLQFRPQ